MTKKSKKYLFVFMLIAVIIGTMTTTYATEPDKKEAKPPVVRIDSYYSNGIIPQNNDIFEIKYQKTGTNDIKEMLVDVSKADGTQEIKVDPGDYTITNIKYKGYNTEVDISGYAIVGSFHVEKDTPGILPLAIGEEEGKKLVENYAHVLSVQNGAYVDGFSKEEEEFVEPLELPDDIPDDPEVEPIAEKEPAETPVKPNTEDKDDSQNTDDNKKESEDQEAKETKMPSFDLQSFLIRTGPLMVTAILIGIFIFIMHKKGKI